MSRDNFSRKTIQVLRERVASICSNPDCRIVTTGPSEKIDKANNIGSAAHICAASKGGPRYDEKMTRQERSHINNAIWLCRNCSFKIDNDEKKYSVNLLKQWKVQAENRALAEIGKPLPDNKDALDTLNAALGGTPKTFLANAIQNIHQVSEDALEKMDPRFVVKTSYQQGNIKYFLYPKDQPISFEVNFTTEGIKLEEILCRYNNTIEYGSDFIVDNCSLNINGSDLLDYLSQSSKGKFSVSPRKSEILATIFLIQKKTNIIEIVGEFKGYISFGSKGFLMELYGFSNYLKLSIQGDYKEKKKLDSRFTLEVLRWDGLDINQLPYFNKIYFFFCRLCNDWGMQIKLEKEGEDLFTIEHAPLKKRKNNIFALLEYTERSRRIASYLNLNIAYTSKISFTAKEHKFIKEVADTVGGIVIADPERLNNCSVIVYADNKLISLLKEGNGLTQLRFIESQGSEISIFNNKFLLPKAKIELHNVYPRLLESSIEQLNVGDKIEIRWMPGENFIFKKYFDKS